MTCRDHEGGSLLCGIIVTIAFEIHSPEGSFPGLHEAGHAVDCVSEYTKQCHFLGTVKHIAFCKQNTQPKTCHCSQKHMELLGRQRGRDIVVCFNRKVEKICDIVRQRLVLSDLLYSLVCPGWCACVDFWPSNQD